MRKIEKWLATIIDKTPNDMELGNIVRDIYLEEKKKKEEDINWKEILDIDDGELKEWYKKLPTDQKDLLDALME